MTGDDTTRQAEFDYARRDAGDESPVVAVGVTFDGTYSPLGLIWTEQRVYFPVTYDDGEYLGSAPRNPPEAAVHASPLGFVWGPEMVRG